MRSIYICRGPFPLVFFLFDETRRKRRKNKAYVFNPFRTALSRNKYFEESLLYILKGFLMFPLIFFFFLKKKRKISKKKHFLNQ